MQSTEDGVQSTEGGGRGREKGQGQGMGKETGPQP